MAKRRTIHPNDPYSWRTKGICACGHPTTRHQVDLGARPPEGIDVCFGRGNTRDREAHARALARGDASDCRCMHLIPFLLVADTRYFRHAPVPGSIDWVDHPFNVGLESYVTANGGPSGLVAWRAPATCRYPGCEAEGVVMRYTDDTQIQSVWVCPEHSGPSRGDLSLVFAPKEVTVSGFLARLVALERRLDALEGLPVQTVFDP